MAIATINPATGEVLKTFEPISDAQLEEKLQRAVNAFGEFRKTSFSSRAAMMVKVAEIVEADKEKLGRVMTTEMGKTYRSAVDEAAKRAWVCRYYAENAEKFLADEAADVPGSKSFVRYQPVGPILAVMPWNYPFWQVFRFIAPSLMAGNVGLLKHASNVPQSALLIEDVLLRAGFPAGVFQTLLIGASKVAKILADPRVRAATLTGSEG
ncbi:MAG: aldehyde dehydrogenase family protein, partial [Candidatus Acidiferrales bacterium]